uniref:PCI domain-containing protein n=1 Tax=Gongylonema pulchrum TaxID=637853 RepID=A0A183DEF8_9BILA
LLMELYTHFRRPITFAIRKALEQINTFEAAKDVLMQEHFVAPSYLIIAGIKRRQACVITR